MRSFSLRARSLVAGSAVAASLLFAGPADATAVANGVFANDVGSPECLEFYAGNVFGFGLCSVSLSVGPFSAVVHHPHQGGCSGVAPATLTINSPTMAAPPANGYLVVSRGVGTFAGTGASGTVTSSATATLVGSLCEPQNDVNPLQTLTGDYQLDS